MNFLLYHTPIFYLIQSLWRDEAFSYFMAKPDIIRVIVNTANDFNPPLYYLLLHFWIMIFGKSDEFLRLLSFLPFIVTVYVAYLLGGKLFGKKFALFVALFTLLNPMLLYYAFEMRMYSFYALFTFCSLYFFSTKNWKWYTIASVLGLYTQSFFLLVIVSYLIYVLFTQAKKYRQKLIFLTFKPLLFYLPWLPILANQFIHSKNSWMFPVDFQLVKSVLGNLFVAYEGTPGNWWHYTAIISILIMFFVAVAARKNRKKAYLFLISIFVPLSSVLVYSVLKRPIYVNRYLIFITVFEIMIVSLGIWSIKGRTLRWSTAILWLMFLIFFNTAITPYHKKTDFKTTFAEINKLAKPEDYVFAKTPIGFLESAYYYKDTKKVFIYNPQNITIPNYIGITATFSDVSRTKLTDAPSRNFLIADDGSYVIVINK